MNTVHSLSYKNAQLNIQFVYVFPKVLAMCWLGEMLFADILFVRDFNVICQLSLHDLNVICQMKVPINKNASFACHSSDLYCIIGC